MKGIINQSLSVLVHLLNILLDFHSLFINTFFDLIIYQKIKEVIRYDDNLEYTKDKATLIMNTYIFQLSLYFIIIYIVKSLE
jgi:hypothetical protein